MWAGNLEIALDHTWDFIEGKNITPPHESKPEYQAWNNW
jgi:hypothetical protein